ALVVRGAVQVAAVVTRLRLLRAEELAPQSLPDWQKQRAALDQLRYARVRQRRFGHLVRRLAISRRYRATPTLRMRQPTNAKDSIRRRAGPARFTSTLAGHSTLLPRPPSSAAASPTPLALPAPPPRGRGPCATPSRRPRTRR